MLCRLSILLNPLPGRNRLSFLCPLTCRQLISTRSACGPSQMWPCLIVQQVQLLAPRDAVIAYFFSAGLLSHIKMIDSFHSGHISQALFDKLIPRVATSILFSCSKVIMFTAADYYYSCGWLFLRLIICVWIIFACASLTILLELSGKKGLALDMLSKSPTSPLYMLSCPTQAVMHSGNTGLCDFLFINGWNLHAAAETKMILIWLISWICFPRRAQVRSKTLMNCSEERVLIILLNLL